MEVVETPEQTYRVRWRGGRLYLNFTPRDRDPHRDTQHLVGVSGLRLNGCPPVPRICWDNREHLFWDGFEGVFEPRRADVQGAAVTLAGGASTVEASHFWIACGVKATVAWQLRDPEGSAHKALWDTRITVQNRTGALLRNFGLFFACYYERAPSYYWDHDGHIKPCGPEGFCVTRNAEEEHCLQNSVFASFLSKRSADHRYARYMQPVLLSSPQPWFGGRRHVLMVRPAECEAVVTWMNQARDYMIRPTGRHLGPNNAFTARIRHVITHVESPSHLQDLWQSFQDQW